MEDQGAIAVMLKASPDSSLKSSVGWAKVLADKFAVMPETDYMWALVGSNSGFGGIITKSWHEREQKHLRSTAAMVPQAFEIVWARGGRAGETLAKGGERCYIGGSGRQEDGIGWEKKRSESPKGSYYRTWGRHPTQENGRTRTTSASGCWSAPFD